MNSALANRNRRLHRSALSVKKAGRAGDSILMHVNPREAAIMEEEFGPASINPHTGLPEHGFFSKLGKDLKFQLSHIKKVTKEIIKNPKRTLTGPTPLGTKLNNAIFHEKKKPLTGQLGGATPDAMNEYEDKHGPGSLGTAREGSAIANTIAGFYAGGAIGNLAGSAAGSLGASPAVADAVGSVASKGAGMATSKLNESGNTGGTSNLSKRKATSLLLSRAGEIANRPYTPYEGQRVAGLSDNEQRASALAQEGNPDAQRLYGKSESAIDDSNKEFNAKNLDPYLSPYRDSGIAKENEEYDRQNSALLNNKAGAFGGDRAAFATSELNRQHMGALTDINAKAYDQATQAFFNDSARKQNAAQAYQSVGGDVARLNRQQIQDLMATGQIDRVVKQANLDFNYQQFVENRDWDITNLEPLLRALGTTGQPGANPKGDNTAAAIGAAATIAGAYFGSSGGGSSGGAASSDWAKQATDAGVS